MDNFAPMSVEQTDQDFEQFVCAAAHNLRESLREIRLRAEGPPNGGMEDQLLSMEAMLDGMVEYSLAGVAESRRSRVDLNLALQQSLQHLEKQILDSSAVVTQDHLPPVMGDLEQVARVLRHLLDNAIKFRLSAAPEIHISAKRDGLHWVLSVHDNGPGIEAPYQERVFLPFKRLHGRNHAGHGLGLAICKKLLAKQGGKIWVESQPECGTTVLFSLPAAN